MKYEVQLRLEVHTFVTVEAEDETGAAQTIITANVSLLTMAAENPASFIEQLDMAIYPEGLLNCSPEECPELQKQIVTFSHEELSGMVDQLFASMSQEEKARHMIGKAGSKG